MSRTQDEFLGRVSEVSLLERALEAARLGDPQFVVVSGEAGIGKSRLLARLAQAARTGGWLVLTGRAAEFEGDLPFGAFVDAFDPYLRTLDSRDLERLAVDRLGVLAAVFPALAGLGDAVDVPLTAAERFRAHRGVGELVERLAARQPVLVVLDDLHWADSASLEVAAHLVRRPPQAAVMVALGARSGHAPAGSHRSVTDIQRSDGVVTLELGPLDRTAVMQLVGVDDSTALDRLHRLSGGNPFYALQLARAGPHAVGDRVGPDDDVPRAVLDSISSELDLLSADARSVAVGAAVVGDPFDLDLVVAACGFLEGRVFDGLDELSVREIVRPAGLPRRFQFRHPLVRNAIYQSSPPGSRLGYHRRIVEALSGRDVAPLELARHVEHAARYGDITAVDVLERAGRDVAAQAPASASRWLTTALAILPALADPARQIDLLQALAMAKGGLGDLAGRLDALRAGLAVVPPDDGRKRTALTLACAEQERLLGHPQRAEARLREAYDGFDDRESADAAKLCVALSANAMYLADYAGMHRWAGEAERVATGLGDQASIVAALAAQTSGAAFSGRIELALDLHRRVEPMLDALSDAVLSDDLGMLSILGGAELYLDLYPSAMAHAERGLRLARASGQSQLMPFLSPIAGTCAWMVGDMPRAVTVLDDAVDSARLVDSPSSLAWHLFNRAYAALIGGDLDMALALSEESLNLVTQLDAGVLSAHSAAVRAYALLEAGRADEARLLLVERVGGEGLTLIPGGWRCIYLEVLVRCHLALGDADRASEAADRARALAIEVPLGIAAMAADRAEGLVALAAGDVDRAIELAQAAIAHAVDIASPVHIATSQALLGRSLAAVGRTADAVAQLRDAADGYDVLGASRYRNQVEGKLRGDQGALGLAALTGRELEVAELVHGRCTNRQIADQLFLSLKTVETHVRHIFEKLGVTSRVGIARLLDSQLPAS
jgi:DNA-binding NarL/FixJ family response regulator